MYPILFEIYGFSVLSYLVIVIAAIVSTILLIKYYEIPRPKSKGYYPDNLDRYIIEILLVALLFTIIGARLGYVITNWHLYADNPLRILAIWRGGLAFHGALLIAVPAAVVHSYFRHISPGNLLDTVIPYICLAYALGRLGCFLNGCCYGQVTEMPWGLIYPTVDSQLRHPTQLYSAAAALTIFLILFLMRRKIYPNGVIFAWFLILIGSYRFVVEFFRVRIYLLGIISLAQLISIALVFTGLIFLVIILKKWRVNLSKKYILLFFITVLLAITLTGCMEEPRSQDLKMFWGIHEQVSGFEDLQREPEGITLEYLDQDTIRLRWQVDNKYILPISATADKELHSIRYLGSEIPSSLAVEWLDPHNRIWYGLDQIPGDMIKLIIEKQNDFFDIDFGPPQGAEFREDMFRVIWFRITPTVTGEFSFRIFGYQFEENTDPDDNRVSNIITLKAVVE